MKTSTEPTKHILFVMDDLANPSKYTQEQKDANAESAYHAAYAAADYAAAASATGPHGYATEYWINKYFKSTGEDKQTYINALTPKPSQPVFTQAMADNGESPVVGMKVKHRSVNKLVMLPADAKSKYVLKSINDMYSLALLHDIKPIDTRTSKEKAIDDMYNEMSRRFDLPKSDSEHMCNDDTQVGVEFLVAYLGDYKW